MKPLQPLLPLRAAMLPIALAVSVVSHPVLAQNIAPLPETEAPPARTQPAVPTPPAVPVRSEGGGIVLNFQGAALGDVLNYLSEAAGFVIVQEAPVSGTVNIVSRQPITGDEAVDLLNTVLADKGFTAIRNGRILRIVNRRDAQKRDLPVALGSDPARIPRNDEIVTQVLPLRHGEAAKVIENLRPLLSETATVSANESSNAILMTDTQSNIRRIALIIQALDTSINSISEITIFPLQYADAKAVADTINQLFAASQPTSSGSLGGRGDRGRGGFGFGGRGGFGGQPGGGAPGGTSGAGQSEARAAAARITAMADQQSNSVIVSAPDDAIPQIREIITQIDTSITDITDTRIFRLQHADAVETAELLTVLYADSASQTGRNGQGGNQGGGRGGQQQGGQQGSAGQSQRALQQSTVVVVGDPRTNSLLVTAARETMTGIAEMVGRLDATDAKKQRVFVHSLEHADAESVAGVLRGMLGGASTGGVAGQTQTSRLTERSTAGAAMDTNSASNQGLGSGGRAR